MGDFAAGLTPFDNIRGEVAIVGVGEAEHTAASGRDPVAMGLAAIEAALADAGLKPHEVDGLMFAGRPGQVSVPAYHAHFGTSHEMWSSPRGGSLTACAIAPYEAAHAIRAGKARTILNVFGIDWATEIKKGTGGPATFHLGEAMKASLEVPYGWIPQPAYFATIARRHMHDYGTTAEQLGSVAVTLRGHANGHPGAVMRDKPLTLEKYLSREPIMDPLRLDDFCLISDGAGAYVMTASDRARDFPHPPVIVQGTAHAVSATGSHFAQQEAFLSTPQVVSSPAAYAMAGITPADVDVLASYDPFTILALMQIEDMGFCKKGEGGPFALDNRLDYRSTRRRGGLPYNTHGGLLSHAYLLGICHVIELVRQLRGTAANQVEDARCAVFGGYTGGDTGTLVLQRGDAA
jgi:acetyl-CoA acetyltransferase